MAQKSVDKSRVMVRLSDLTSEPKRMLPPIKGYENQPIVSLEKSVEPLISFVPDVEQMVWTVKQNCKNPEDNLSPDESASIMLYSLEWEPPESSFYFILNSTLRSENRQNLRSWFLYLRLITIALTKLPSVSSRKFHRGTQMGISREFVKGKTFIWWSFSSCVLTMEVIKQFLGETGPRTIINIESDSAKDISRHSFYRTENEILLYPARQFKVISCLNFGYQLHIIQIKEIQPPFPLIHIPPTISTAIFIAPDQNPHKNQKLQDLIEKCQPRSEVKLSCQQLTDEGIDIVVNEAIISKQCKEFLLNSTEITSAGVSIIAEALNENTTLEILMLSYNPVGDLGVHFLTKTLSLNNSSLWRLHLGSTGITDEGVAYLAEMLKTNSTLRHLFLCGNNIGNRGIKLLANTLIYHNSTFELLDVSKNKLVTDSSVDSLFEMLQQNRSLLDLNISNCNLSKGGKERLQQILQTKRKLFLIV